MKYHSSKPMTGPNALRQLPLAWVLDVPPAFGDFLPGANVEALAAMQSLPAAGGIYLWGARGTGKTHLLRAAARTRPAGAPPLHYFSCRNGLPPAAEIAIAGGVAVDDLDEIAQTPTSEEAIFHLFNRVRDAGLPFLCAARADPRTLPLQLSDLISRLSSLLVYRLHELADDDKLRALATYGARRGFHVPEDVGRYLLARLPRDLCTLTALLDSIDPLLISTQRRLTVPFLKEMEPHWAPRLAAAPALVGSHAETH